VLYEILNDQNESVEDIQTITDKKRIKQILLNLLSNALKFTDWGMIKFTCRPIEDTLLFAVIDTGLGISDKDKENLFKEFGMGLDNSYRNKSGTGLGLSICKKLSNALGGNIWSES